MADEVERDEAGAILGLGKGACLEQAVDSCGEGAVLVGLAPGGEVFEGFQGAEFTEDTIADDAWRMEQGEGGSRRRERSWTRSSAGTSWGGNY
jgi:hypothetical protein